MGACCTLLKQSCKKPVRITDKVNSLYNLSSGENEAQHARDYSKKLRDFLSDRPKKVKKSVSLINKIWKKALNDNPSSSDISVLAITLYSLKTLTTVFHEFLSMTYKLCYSLMIHSLFPELKPLVYDLLLQCTSEYKDYPETFLEEIMQELIEYCRNLQNPSEQELNLVSNICLIEEDNLVNASGISWTDCMEIVLKRLLIGSEFIEELGLLNTLLKISFKNHDLMDTVIKYVFEELEEQKGWNPRCELIFNGFLECEGTHNGILKTVVFYLREALNEEKNIEYPVKCILHLFNLSKEAISTVFYNTTFLEVLSVIFVVNQEYFKRIVEGWTRRHEETGIFKLVKLVVFKDEMGTIDKNIIKWVLQALKTTDLDRQSLQALLEIISELSSKLYLNPEEILYSVYRKLIESYKLKLKLKRIDCRTIGITCLKVFWQVDSVNSYYQTLKILLGLVSTHSKEKLLNTLEIASTLKEMMGEMRDKAKFCVAGVILLALLQKISETYKLEGLAGLVESIGSETKLLEKLEEGITKKVLAKFMKEPLKFSSEIFCFESLFDFDLRAFDLDREFKRQENYNPFGFSSSDSELSSVVSDWDRSMEPNEGYNSGHDYFKTLVYLEDKQTNLLRELVS